MLAVIVNGLPGAGKTTLARRLAPALGLPLFSKDAIKETFADVIGVLAPRPEWNRLLGAASAETIWTLLGDSTNGAVVESPYLMHVRHFVLAGLARAGVDQGDVHEVWCDVPFEIARARFDARAEERHPIHGDDRDKDAEWEAWRSLAEPLAIGTVHRLDTSAPVPEADLRALAEKIRVNA